MSDGKTDKSAAEDLKTQNQRASVQFRTQHGLVVAFFLLLLYVRIPECETHGRY